MELVVSQEDGGLAIRPVRADDSESPPDDQADEAEAMRPVYRGGLRWDLGGQRFIFVPDGAGAHELRVDSGGGHYVLKRVGR